MSPSQGDPAVKRPLRVGIIGLGVGEQHALAFGRHPSCRVEMLCDRSAERLEAVRGRFPGARLTGSAAELIEDADLDVVSIASHDQDHFEQTVSALRRGKHVFVEKPLCRSLAELADVRQAWRESGTRLASNLVLRAAPLYRWLREQVAAGALGELYAVDGDYLYGRLEKITSGWRRDVRDYSVMLGGGIHLVDLLMWTSGQRPSRVTAVGGRIVTRGSAFQYDDFRSATFEFPSGLVGRITANFGCVHPHQHVLRVFGTSATFLHDDRGARWREVRDPERPAVALDQPALPASKGELIPGFVAEILAGTRGGAEHELDVISACLAADRAAETGTPQEIVYS